jgi:hypothetical protein
MAFELRWVRQNLHRLACVRYRVALELESLDPGVMLMKIQDLLQALRPTTREVLHVDEKNMGLRINERTAMYSRVKVDTSGTSV